MEDNIAKGQITETEISLKEIILNFKKFLGLVYRKRLFLLVFAISGGLLGILYSLFVKPVYKAEFTFVVEDNKSNLGGAAGLASQLGFDIGGSSTGAFSGDNILEIIKSRLMVEKTLLSSVLLKTKKRTLIDLYIDVNHLKSSWGNEPELQNIEFLPDQDRNKFSLKMDSVIGIIYKRLLKNELIVDKLDKKLSIVTVIVNSKSELFAKYFTEILVNNVSSFYIETKTKKELENVRTLQYQTDSVRHQLNSAISGVAQTIDINPNVNATRQVLRVPSQKRQVDVQANTAILTELVKNLEIAKISLRRETPLIQAIDKPILPLENNKIKPWIAFLFGGLISFIFGVILVLVRNSIRKIMSNNF